MFPRRGLSQQRGSMLIIALFVIIVLALLGLTMTRMLTATSQSTVIQLYGVRALTAAQSGIQVLLQQSFPLNSVPQTCNTSINSPVTFSNVDGFKSCSYSAACTTEEVVKAGEINYFYRITASGECLVGDVVVNRQILLEAMQELP